MYSVTDGSEFTKPVGSGTVPDRLEWVGSRTVNRAIRAGADFCRMTGVNLSVAAPVAAFIYIEQRGEHHKSASWIHRPIGSDSRRPV
jgi:hypothetical protein